MLQAPEYTKFVKSIRLPYANRVYHSTFTRNAISIINQDVIEHGGIIDRQTGLEGVSLTRCKNFAYNYIIRGRIILEFNFDKIRSKYETFPTNYNHLHGEHFRIEAEEFLPGDFLNIEKYLTRIIIPSVTELDSLHTYGNGHVIGYHPKAFYNGKFLNEDIYA